jgi:hypothetical protein
MSPAPPAGRVIALLGADEDAKAALADAMAQRLEERGIGAKLVVVAAPEEALEAEALEACRQALILLVASPSHTTVDNLLRKSLIDAHLGFAVVHGQGQEQLANALNAVGVPADADAHRAGARALTAWSWNCEKCSDPVCEHRLFTDLLAQRR